MANSKNIPTVEIGVRAFVFGGSCSNLQATEAVLNRATDLGFTANEIIFTGDMIAYCGQPAETAHLIRQAGVHAIMGNCEESIAFELDDCGCGFADGSACDALSQQWFNHCLNVIDADTRLWMQQLPRFLDIELGDFTLRCIHGTPEAINEFIFPSDIAAGRYTPRNEDGIDGYICGHSGIPFAAEVSNKVWINSGSAGMPANDGTSRVWYALFESAQIKLKVSIESLDYDHEVAASIMRKRGLDNGYADCLSSGIWPSHDVLPAEERQITGIPILPSTFTFKKKIATVQDPQLA